MYSARMKSFVMPVRTFSGLPGSSIKSSNSYNHIFQQICRQSSSQSALLRSRTTSSRSIRQSSRNISRRYQRNFHAQSRGGLRQQQQQRPPQPPEPQLLQEKQPVQKALTLSQRFKELSKKYGWSAVGVYFFLSALDFPFCFLAVRFIGTERIGHLEHVIFERLYSLVPESLKWGKGASEASPSHSAAAGEVDERGLSAVPAVDGISASSASSSSSSAVVDSFHEATADSSNATLWTQLALAYAIHKSFIFLRIPATIAVTPRIVKFLQGLGWNVGKRTAK